MSSTCPSTKVTLPHIKSIAMLNNSAKLYACSSCAGLKICDLIKRDLIQWLMINIVNLAHVPQRLNIGISSIIFVEIEHFLRDEHVRRSNMGGSNNREGMRQCERACALCPLSMLSNMWAIEVPQNM